jgi:hypothetical protein
MVGIIKNVCRYEKTFFDVAVLFFLTEKNRWFYKHIFLFSFFGEHNPIGFS